MKNSSVFFVILNYYLYNQGIIKNSTINERMNNLITRLFLLAIAPAISIAISMYMSDKYEKEPIPLLVKIFILGAVSVVPVLIVERFLSMFNVFYGILGVLYTAFIIAGLTEEYFKRAVVLRYIYMNKNFNEKLDGIVYCVFSALGFSTVENIIYVVFRFSNNAYVGLYRGILSVPAHCIFAVTMGYYISLSKFSHDEAEKKRYLRKSLFIPAILHGIFDFILMSNLPLYSFILIPYALYLWISNKRKLDKYILDSRENNKEL